MVHLIPRNATRKGDLRVICQFTDISAHLMASLTDYIIWKPYPHMVCVILFMMKGWWWIKMYWTLMYTPYIKKIDFHYRFFFKKNKLVYTPSFLHSHRNKIFEPCKLINNSFVPHVSFPEVINTISLSFSLIAMLCKLPRIMVTVCFALTPSFIGLRFAGFQPTLPNFLHMKVFGQPSRFVRTV